MRHVELVAFVSLPWDFGIVPYPFQDEKRSGAKKSNANSAGTGRASTVIWAIVIDCVVVGDRFGEDPPCRAETREDAGGPV